MSQAKDDPEPVSELLDEDFDKADAALAELLEAMRAKHLSKPTDRDEKRIRRLIRQMLDPLKPEDDR